MWRALLLEDDNDSKWSWVADEFWWPVSFGVFRAGGGGRGFVSHSALGSVSVAVPVCTVVCLVVKMIDGMALDVRMGCFFYCCFCSLPFVYSASMTRLPFATIHFKALWKDPPSYWSQFIGCFFQRDNRFLFLIHFRASIVATVMNAQQLVVFIHLRTKQLLTTVHA